MNRRRMMMLSLKKDLLDGYRHSWKSAHTVTTNWLADDVLQIYHTWHTFSGPESMGMSIFGSEQKASTAIGLAISKTPMETLDVSKTYRLTLTVIEVAQNTATAENDGVFSLTFGPYSSSTKASVNLSEIVVGTKLELTRNANTLSYIGGAAIGATGPSLQWDFKFKVEFVEV